MKVDHSFTVYLHRFLHSHSFFSSHIMCTDFLGPLKTLFCGFKIISFGTRTKNTFLVFCLNNYGKNKTKHAGCFCKSKFIHLKTFQYAALNVQHVIFKVWRMQTMKHCHYTIQLLFCWCPFKAIQFQGYSSTCTHLAVARQLQ